MVMAASSPLARYLGKKSSLVSVGGASIEDIWPILFHVGILGVGRTHSLLLQISLKGLSPF